MADDHDGWTCSLVLKKLWVSVTRAGCQPVAWDPELTVPKRCFPCTRHNPSGNLSHDPSTFCSNSSLPILFKTSAMPLQGHTLAGRILKVFLNRSSSKK